MIDGTHDPGLRSWVESANAHPEFPIQNLPLGVFSISDTPPRGGIAIGDFIVDVAGCLEADLFHGAARDAAEAASGPNLNPLLCMGRAAERALRQRLSEILNANGPDRARIEAIAARLLHPAADCTMHLPATIGDYTDFFAGIQHATNTGRLFRPDNPLLPNYKYVPVAYHGRASSVFVSGTVVRRPNGQRNPPTQPEPTFGTCRNLDYELELGVWIGPGNAPGEPIPISEAAEHVAGLCLLNDWAARDIQAWEYQPLGPFLAKNFCTTVSPWIVTAEALAPFRVGQASRPPEDPPALPYLLDSGDEAAGALDIVLEVSLLTPSMRESGAAPQRISQVNAQSLYWTVAQMVAHHTSGGCNLQPGDLFGSGTISGTDPATYGSLLEITQGGRQPLRLSTGEERRFLEDGDEVIFQAHCRREEYVSIGFGECRGRIVPAIGQSA
jgi:fumarylacetoacetase